MAEITKISSPLIPKENVGNKFKPVTDQAAEINDPQKIHKPSQEGKILDQNTSNILKENMGRAALIALLKNTDDLSAVVKRLALLIETGISATEVMADPELKLMMDSVFVAPEQVMSALEEQDKSSVLFKGEVFTVLRDLLSRFEDNPKIRDAVASLLKSFECNVNTESSIRSILLNCENVLEYLFTKDRAQFSDYLDGLAQAILPKQEAADGQPARESAAGQAPQGEQARTVPGQAQTPGQTAGTSQEPLPAGQLPAQAAGEGEAAAQQQAQNPAGAQGDAPVTEQQAAQEQTAGGQPIQQQPAGDRQATGQAAQQAPPASGEALPAGQSIPLQAPSPQAQTQQAQQAQQAQEQAEPQLTNKEIAQILKGNLLPLLGEIVVKYNQNEKIRDHVMIAVHNTVRVDQGTPESVRAAVSKLVYELRQVANLPEGYQRNLTNAILESAQQAKQSGNKIMERLVDVINETLRSEKSTPATLRQAETLLMSLLQNQSPVMDLLHFILPIMTPTDQMIAEMYVDPDAGNKSGEDGKQGRKIFVSFESQVHGNYELSFFQSGDYVDFNMWCPGALVQGLSGMKKLVGNIMQTHGYTLNSYQVEEFRRPQSVAEVFPDLLNRRVGIDVRV